MVVVMKSIKPKRLDAKAMNRELLKEMRRTAKDITKDFEGTTVTWKHKVKFESAMTVKPKGPEVLVATDDEIYGYVDKGTKPHDIWAGAYTGKSTKKTLAFPSAFTPKTKPGSLKSGPGSKGEVDTFTPYVRHPGSKPRGFSKNIAKKNKPKFRRAMEAGMRKARAVSGNPA